MSLLGRIACQSAPLRRVSKERLGNMELSEFASKDLPPIFAEIDANTPIRRGHLYFAKRPSQNPIHTSSAASMPGLNSTHASGCSP